MSWRLVAAATLLMWGSSLGAQIVTSIVYTNNTPVDRTTQAQDVRFRTGLGDRMTVPVRLSGAGPYQFLVDTGADRSAVSTDIASRLSLVPGARAQLHSTTGVSEISTAKVPSLEFTRPAQTSIEAAVLERANLGADGIVGADLLRSQRVQFDFEKQTMTIVPASTTPFHDEPGTIVVEARRKNGRLIMTDAYANGQKITVVIDTGSDICVGNEALRRRLAGRNLLDANQTVELQSVTGQVLKGDYMFLRDLDMGGIALQHVAIAFADAHTFKQLKLNDAPAMLLGMNAFRAFRKVSIDFANRQFRVVVPLHSELDARLAMTRVARP